VGVIDSVPESWKSRRTGEAITAPSAILMAGAGAAAGILAGLAALPVVGIAAAAWLVRVATLLPRRASGERIDPMSISDPWRGFVRDALDAQRRYRKAVAAANEGPLRARLVEIGERIDAGVSECWRVARRGDALVDAIGNLDVLGARKDLDEAKRARTRNEVQESTVKALQAQVDTADRLIDVAEDAQDRLRLLDARLDEAVARAVELSIRAEDVGELSGLDSQVDEVVSEMESLRIALDEAGGTAQAAGAA
jgi:ribosomal protein S20